MRPWILFAGLAHAACTAVPQAPPEDPATLTAALADPDPERREEALGLLARRGRTAQAWLEEHRPEALALLERDSRSMAAELDGVMATERGSWDRALWRAWHVIRTGCLAREWTALSKALTAQRFQLREIYEPQESGPRRYVRFLARRGAFVDASGRRHDLLFWVSLARREGEWIAREVHVVLHAGIHAPFKDVVERRPYPEGSVLRAFLGQPQLRPIAAVHPTLDEVELSYGRIRVEDGAPAPAGFHVNASFTGAGGIGGRGVTYTVEAAFDPPEGPDGRLLRGGFAPRGALGEFVLRGSSLMGGGFRPSDD